MELTYDLCMAIGRDAGDHNMKAHDRKVWNDDDWNIAAKASNELLETLEHSDYKGEVS